MTAKEKQHLFRLGSTATQRTVPVFPKCVPGKLKVLPRVKKKLASGTMIFTIIFTQDEGHNLCAGEVFHCFESTLLIE
jgi:hypothetical protein